MFMQSCLCAVLISVASSHCQDLDGSTFAGFTSGGNNIDKKYEFCENSSPETLRKITDSYATMMLCLEPIIEENHLSTEETLEIYCGSKLSLITTCVYPYLERLSGCFTSHEPNNEHSVRRVFDAVLDFCCRKEDNKYILVEFIKYSAQCFDGTNNKLSGLMSCIPQRKQILETTTWEMCEQLFTIERCIKEKAQACCDHRVKNFFNTLINDVNGPTPCEL